MIINNLQEGQQEDRKQGFAKDAWISKGMELMRDWMTQSFKQGLLSGGLSSWYSTNTKEIEVSAIFSCLIS